MPENRQDISLKVYGGLNVADQEDQLVLRNFQATQAGFSQVYPAESPDMVNIDYTKTGIKKRSGSTADRDLSGVVVAGEELIDGTEFVDAADGTRYELIVGKKSIYISTDGSAFSQINSASTTAYVHVSDVSMLSFAQIAGHLFIGLDNTNEIQVFRTGTDLDPSYASGNNFIEAYDTTAVNAITNVIPTGAYILTVMGERLVYSKGNTLVYYTYTAYSTGGLWDSPAAQFFTTSGKVLSLNAFAPHYDDSLNEALYTGTENGFEIMPGLDLTVDEPAKVKGARSPINNRAVVASKNWLVYLTRQKNIYAINRTAVIDLGRRLKNDIDGPLDDLNLAASASKAFCFYSNEKEQVYIFYSDTTLAINNRCAVIDFKLGEPVPGESLTQFETRVRPLDWKLRYNFADTEAPYINYWYTGMYQISGEILAIWTDSAAASFSTYCFLSTNEDLDTAAVSSKWYSPVFLALAEEDSKQWMALTSRVLPKGSHTLTVELYINRAQAATTTYTFEQYDTGYAIWDTATWDASQWVQNQVVKNINDIDLYSDALQWSYSNTGVAQPFEISSCALRYMIGAEER